jgi:hypothetical protein
MCPRLAVSLTLVAVSSAQACANGPTPEDHRQALIETREAWGRAIAAGDVDDILSVWTDDVVIFPASEPGEGPQKENGSASLKSTRPR